MQSAFLRPIIKEEAGNGDHTDIACKAWKGTAHFNVIDEYLKQGEERGAERKEAEVNERVAIDMLKEKEPIQKIVRYSRLPEAIIRQLAKSMGVAVL